LDIALVVVLAVYGQLEAWGAPNAETAIAGPPALNAAAFLIASVALLWRRRAPATVLLIEAANLAVLSVLAGDSEALGLFVPLLISVYSAARVRHDPVARAPRAGRSGGGAAAARPARPAGRPDGGCRGLLAHLGRRMADRLGNPALE
jgi:hypothetical protein